MTLQDLLALLGYTLVVVGGVYVLKALTTPNPAQRQQDLTYAVDDLSLGEKLL